MDIVAGLLCVCGTALIALRVRWGFLLCLSGGILWLIVGYTNRLFGLFVEVIPLMFFNIFGFINWTLNEKGRKWINRNKKN